MALEDLLDRVAEPTDAAAPAILDARGRVVATRGALGARVRAYSGAFAQAGIEAGDPVAFGVRQDADGIAWLLGALRAGIVVVVLDPGVAPALLAAQCRAAGVRAVVTDGGVATLTGSRVLRSVAARRGVRLPDPATLAPARWATSRVLGIDRPPRLDRLAGGDARRSLPGDAAALVPFTSGTTGSPRGVVHSSASLATTLEQASALVELGPGDRVLGTGLHLIGPALLAGAAVVLPPGRGGTDALARTTRVAGVTHASLPLHRATAWAAAGGAGARLQALLLGSAPVRNAALGPLVASLPGVRVASIYGMTEHLLVARVDAQERLAFDERDGDLVGTPLAGVRLRTDERGELHVAGPALARGYLGEPQPVPELPTGDLGTLDAAGRLVLRGRRKEMLIRGGENIYPSLYEPALAAAARLETAIMVGVDRPDGDEVVVLFAVPRAGDDPEQARRRLESVAQSTDSPLDAHARPDVVLAIDALPRAGRSDKPDRRALSAVAAARLDRGDR
jgi:acyl-CoA synthetase (AMP-forming)/AMP-acid ligase II